MVQVWSIAYLNGLKCQGILQLKLWLVGTMAKLLGKKGIDKFDTTWMDNDGKTTFKMG